MFTVHRPPLTNDQATSVAPSSRETFHQSESRVRYPSLNASPRDIDSQQHHPSEESTSSSTSATSESRVRSSSASIVPLTPSIPYHPSSSPRLSTSATSLFCDGGSSGGAVSGAFHASDSSSSTRTAPSTAAPVSPRVLSPPPLPLSLPFYPSPSSPLGQLKGSDSPQHKQPHTHPILIQHRQQQQPQHASSSSYPFGGVSERASAPLVVKPAPILVSPASSRFSFGKVST